MSISRYRLIDQNERRAPTRASARTSLAKLNSMLEPHKAPPISLDKVRSQEVSGWVLPLGMDAFDGIEDTTSASDLAWDLSHCEVDQGFVLRLRTEKRQVPTQLMQLLLRERSAECYQRTGKLPDAKERRDLKETIQRELSKRALPNIGHIDGFWRDTPGELLVFATSKKACEQFTNAFTETFAKPLKQKLINVTPPLMGLPDPAWRDSRIGSASLDLLLTTTPVSILGTALRNDKF